MVFGLRIRLLPAVLRLVERTLLRLDLDGDWLEVLSVLWLLVKALGRVHLLAEGTIGLALLRLGLQLLELGGVSTVALLDELGDLGEDLLEAEDGLVIEDGRRTKLVDLDRVRILKLERLTAFSDQLLNESLLRDFQRRLQVRLALYSLAHFE